MAPTPEQAADSLADRVSAFVADNRRALVVGAAAAVAVGVVVTASVLWVPTGVVRRLLALGVTLLRLRDGLLAFAAALEAARTAAGTCEWWDEE